MKKLQLQKTSIIAESKPLPLHKEPDKKFLCFKKNSILKNLSFQEIKIMKLIGLGYTTKEISEILFLSPRTVEIHRQNIFKKLNIKKRHELVRIFIDSGLILSELPCYKNPEFSFKYCYKNKKQCPHCGLFVSENP